MLPGLGNGTYRFSIYADDPEGRTTLLGTRTITCDNANATQPFGAIDTPTPGETVDGSNYTSYGWVLARGPRRADVPGGGTVNVLIDGVNVGSPTGWSARSDLTGLFPATQFPGVSRALAVFPFDTRTLSNGMHTMAWVVTDDQGNAAGVGSRYFRVFNGSASALTLAPEATSEAALTRGSELTAAREHTAVQARRGYSTDVPLRRYEADSEGRVTLQAEELDRIELETNGATTGYLVSGSDLRPLPVGSRLDPATGNFLWQPGVGFIGSYDLAFVRNRGGQQVRQDVRIVLNPKGSNRVGPQLVVDIAPGPREDATDGIVAGWAADLDSTDGTGVQMIHAWAYPRGGGAPIFVADAAYGGARPDVAEVFGERFRDSGYGLRVSSLPPGTYDLALFAWSTARHAWLPAKLVTIKIQ
jgi:hypothetical protein